MDTSKRTKVIIVEPSHITLIDGPSRLTGRYRIDLPEHGWQFRDPPPVSVSCKFSVGDKVKTTGGTVGVVRECYPSNEKSPRIILVLDVEQGNNGWTVHEDDCVPCTTPLEEQREALAKEYLEARRRNKEALEALHNAGMKVLSEGGSARIYLDTEIETKQWVVVKEPVRQWYGEEK